MACGSGCRSESIEVFASHDTLRSVRTDPSTSSGLKASRSACIKARAGFDRLSPNGMWRTAAPPIAVSASHDTLQPVRTEPVEVPASTCALASTRSARTEGYVVNSERLNKPTTGQGWVQVNRLGVGQCPSNCCAGRSPSHSNGRLVYCARSACAASTMFPSAARVSGQPRVLRPQSGLTHRFSDGMTAAAFFSSRTMSSRDGTRGEWMS